MGLDGAAGATGDGERGRGEVKGSRSCVRMEVFISSGALWLFEQVGPHPSPPHPCSCCPSRCIHGGQAGVQMSCCSFCSNASPGSLLLRLLSRQLREEAQKCLLKGGK